MSRHLRPDQHHERPREERLRAVVARLVADDCMKDAYLLFAREFARSIHRKPFPDFEMGTKRVVLRWFKRGLHGHLLWLVGQAILQEWPS